MHKKIIHLTILTLLLLLPAINSFADGFYSVYSKDGSNVWAVGNTGNLWKSADGGLTWSSNTLGSATYYSVFAVGSNVWIAGTGGALQRSYNNGVGWTASTISAQTLKSIFFTDANTGWIVGNAGTILRTIDAGASWTAQTSPVSNNLNSVKFTSSTNGVACGDGGRVIYTVNGGGTWFQYTTPTTKNLLAIDQKVSTIIATAEDAIVIKSTNNGTSWSTINYKIDTKSNVTGISMIDANTFYSCGGGGFIRKSVDGGATFTFQQNPQMGNLMAIYFYNASSGWAVSSLNNAILRTADGGNTWSFPAGTTISFSWTLKVSTSGNIGNGFCLHPTNKNAFFCMMGNNVYRSLDRGETWTNIAFCSIGGSCHSFYVSPLDTNLMLCSKGSGGGYVARSTDYGVTWTAVYGPGSLTSYGMPLEMDQNNPNVCYLGPDGSTLMRSTNFGLTWTTNWGAPPASYNGGYFRSPCDFAIAPENSNIMYCGDGTTGSGNGALLKSTNSGQNWTVVHSISGSEIPMLTISSLDPNLAYHTTWSSGGFWKSTDQFTNYTQVTTTGNMWAADIARDDPTAVSYGTYGTTMYISTDAGTTFTSTSAGGSYGAGVLFYDKGTLIYQQGTGIYKLNNVSYIVPTAIHQISSEAPKQFALLQNYPNPFNPSTNIKYQIAKNSEVQIKIFDALGRELQTLFSGQLSAGTYESNWSGTNYTSGIYFYSLIVNGERVDTRKMMLVK